MCMQRKWVLLCECLYTCEVCISMYKFAYGMCPHEYAESYIWIVCVNAEYIVCTYEVYACVYLECIENDEYAHEMCVKILMCGFSGVYHCMFIFKLMILIHK